MKATIGVFFLALWGLAIPQPALSYSNPDYWRVSWYQCDPAQCWNSLFVPAGFLGETSTTGDAECGNGQNPETPHTHPDVYVHTCSTDAQLTTGVAIYSYDSYDPDIGNFTVQGLRGDGTISIPQTGYTWYAGFDEQDCDGSGEVDWPPEEAC